VQAKFLGFFSSIPSQDYQNIQSYRDRFSSYQEMYFGRAEVAGASLASTSASSPPPLVSSESHGTRILAASGTLMALSIVVVSVRMFVKTTMLKNIGVDDYIVCFQDLLSYI
jgi:hypothetical protein